MTRLFFGIFAKSTAGCSGAATDATRLGMATGKPIRVRSASTLLPDTRKDARVFESRDILLKGLSMRTFMRLSLLCGVILVGLSTAWGGGWFMDTYPPDIAVQRIEVKPPAPMDNSIVKFVVVLKNDGRAELAGVPIRMIASVVDENGKEPKVEPPLKWRLVEFVEKLDRGATMIIETPARRLDVPAGVYRFVVSDTRIGGKLKRKEKDLADNELAQTFVVRLSPTVVAPRVEPVVPVQPVVQVEVSEDTLRDLRALRARARDFKEKVKPEQAIPVYKRVYSLAQKTLPRLHSFTLETLAEYVGIVQWNNKFAETEELRAQQVELLTELHGKDGEELIEPLQERAWNNSLGLKRYDAAIAGYDRVEKLRRKHGRLRGYEAGRFYFCYGCAVVGAKRYAQALDGVLERGVRLQESSSKPEMHWLDCHIKHIKECCKGLGKKAEDCALYKRAMRLKEGYKPRDPVESYHLVRNRASDLSNKRKYKEAIPIMEKAVAEAKGIPGSRGCYWLSEALGILGDYEERAGKLDDARRHLEGALTVGEKMNENDLTRPGRMSVILGGLAEFYEKRDSNFDGAEKMLRRSIVVQERAKGANHFHVGCEAEKLGEFLLRRKRFEEARQVLERALAIYVESHGGKDHYTMSTLRKLEKACRGTGDQKAAQKYRARYEAGS